MSVSLRCSASCFCTGGCNTWQTKRYLDRKIISLSAKATDKELVVNKDKVQVVAETTTVIKEAAPYICLCKMPIDFVRDSSAAILNTNTHNPLHKQVP